MFLMNPSFSLRVAWKIIEGESIDFYILVMNLIAIEINKIRVHGRTYKEKTRYVLRRRL